MKKIAVIITNRTNYSKLKLVLLKLRDYADIKIEIIASSSILLEKYGKPIQDLEKDGFTIDVKIDCILMNDSHEAMVNTVGLSMIQHSSYFKSFRPDIVLVVGDRFDTIAPALAASLMNIPIAHIQGGELSGSIDDKIRDIITKMSTLHFVATEKSHNRLLQLGMREELIFNYGCPAVEYISTINIGDEFDPALVHKQFKHPLKIEHGEKYFLIMVHPDTTKDEDVSMDVILKAVATFDIKTFIFYPNVDASNSNILAGISNHRSNKNFINIKHMPLEGFIHTMAHSACFIGNSSSGIREAATFGVPVVNIGDRQIGRERTPNTIDVTCGYDEIVNGIQKGLDSQFDNTNPYYQEGCSEKIAARIIEHMGND